MRYRCFLAATVVLAGVAGVNNALPNASNPAARAVIYNIPAEALDYALNSYIKLSGAQVFYETAITEGRRSTSVLGRFSSAAALRALLLGTGLISHQTDADAFIVTAAPDNATGTSSTAVSTGDPFLGTLQAGVLKALCANPRVHPGPYKVAVELWISPAGVIQRSDLIGSTGDAARDAALGATLQGVVIGEAPPDNVPQPLVMIIAPRSSGEPDACARPRDPGL